METIHTDIEIEATPEQVWAVLSDFESYPEWNPFITSIKGAPEPGTKLEATLQLKGKKPQTFKPEVTQAEPGRVFEWLGHLGVKGIFDGRHHFQLEATDNGTHFVQREEFSGILALPILRMVREATEGGFHAMNLAIKERAEAA